MREPMKRLAAWLTGMVVLLLFFLCFTGTTTGAATHSYVQVERIEPTCTQEGQILYQCEYCEATRVESIPALGHDYREVARTEATTEQEGSVIYICSRCGETYTEVLPKLDPATQPATETATDATDSITQPTAGQAEEDIGDILTAQAADSGTAAWQETQMQQDLSATQQEMDTGQQELESAQQEAVSAETAVQREMQAESSGESEGKSMARIANATEGIQEMETAGVQNMACVQSGVTIASQFNAVSAALLFSSAAVCAAGIAYAFSYRSVFQWAARKKKETRQEWMQGTTNEGCRNGGVR